MHSPAFNTVKMTWVAGLGEYAVDQLLDGLRELTAEVVAFLLEALENFVDRPEDLRAESERQAESSTSTLMIS